MIDSFDEVFKGVVDYCSKNGDIASTALGLWIEPIKPLRLEGNKAVMEVDTEFQRGIVMQQYSALLQKGFKEILGFDVEIDIQVSNSDPSSGNAEENSSSGSDTDKIDENNADLKKKMDYAKYDYTFDTFIVGSSNEFAYHACKGVVKGGGVVYNPLFIYGPSGLGKTHLITATATEMRKNDPSLNIVYVTGETFASEIIEAIQKKSTAEFHNKYRSADVLLVDDIQFIAGKESTQEEFFHTFNALYQDNKQILLAADRPPKAIKTLEDRIRSRFESGLMADIQTPDFETRMAIIKRKAELLDLNMPDDVAEFIANKIKTNIRQLEGAVKKLKVLNHYAGSKPTIQSAQGVIREIMNDDQPLPVTIEKIINEVANVYGVSPDDIRSSKRVAQVSTARKVAIYIVRQITGMSLTYIGSEFGGRDHSTIVYAVNDVAKNLETDDHLKELIDDITKNIHDYSNS